MDNLIPPRCLICGSAGDIDSGLCTSCREKIRRVPLPVCDICGKSIGTPGVCIACQTKKPEFDRMLVAACYEGVLKDIIHAFKYHRQTVFKGFLANLLYERVAHMDTEIDVITGVPLHWRKSVQRGFNQSSLIAKDVAKLTGVEFRHSVLRKIKGTVAQVGLDRKTRLKNLKGTLQAYGVEGKAVMVVDDVITTGATAAEAAMALKKAGATYVLFAGVARAVS